YDAWSISLLLGVRDSDLHGVSITDLPQHDIVDYSSEDQRDHCLRAPEQVDAVGDQEAAGACRDFLRTEVQEAIAGLGKTETASVALKYQQADVTVDSFPFHLGHALHTVEDSFSHTYRTDGFQHLARIFNYVSPALAKD